MPSVHHHQTRRTLHLPAVLACLFAVLLGLRAGGVFALESGHSPDHWLNHFQIQQSQSPPGCALHPVPRLNIDKPSRAFEITPPAGVTSGHLIAYSQDTIAERIIFLAKDNRGCIHIGETGRGLPFASRSVNSALPNVRFPADLVADEPVIAIIEDRKSVRPWLKLSPESAFNGTNTEVWAMLGAYTGIIAVLFLVGSGIAWWHRSGLALAYVFYIGTLQVWQLQALGLGVSLVPFWPGEDGFVVMQALSVTGVIAGISTLVTAFIKPVGLTRRLLVGGVIMTCLIYLTSIFTPISYRIASFMLMLVATLALYLLVQKLRSGQIPVRWFAIGFFASMIGGGIQAATVVSGGAGFPPIAVAAFPISTVFEAAFWMIALASALRAERLDMERKLYADATHDSLTGLYNRAFLTARIEEQLLLSRANPEARSGLLFIDLDRFKFINDSLGHKLGDEALTEVAHGLQQVSMGNHIVGRFGGDEFAILLHDDTHWASAVGIATSIVKRFEDPVRIGHRDIAISASVGIVPITPDYVQADDIIRDADTALYAAKAKGGGRYETFDTSMQESARDVIRLESALQKSLERNEFELYYQPIIDLGQNNPAGFEALARWNHPEHGLLAPRDFLPNAERTGFIRTLGSHLIERAIQQVWNWQDEGRWRHGLHLCINASGQQLLNDELLEVLDRCLDQYPVPPHSLRLEFSETALFSDLDTARRILPRLRDRKVILCLDDFGTGTASLSLLSEFDFDVVKVDTSSIEGITHQEKAQHLMNSVLSISSHMGFMVVAEGVERKSQMSLLKTLGCSYAQGHHFAPPMPADEAMEWLNLWRMAPKHPSTVSEGHPVH